MGILLVNGARLTCECGAAPMNILVIDDEEETLEVIASSLERAGHSAELARSGSEARVWLQKHVFDVLVLDVMLPDGSGIDLCAGFRRAGIQTPILFLSARGAVGARVEGLEAGGDDYLSKPFALKELLARIRALGRRGPDLSVRSLTLGDVMVDIGTRQIRRAGTELPLTAREWAVLHGLLSRRGHIVSYDALQEIAWGEASDSARASLEVIIARLRRKLDSGQGSTVIRTVRGVGYSIGSEA